MNKAVSDEAGNISTAETAFFFSKAATIAMNYSAAFTQFIFL